MQSLNSTHPDLKFDALVLLENRLHLEVDADGADEGRRERVVRVPEEEGRLADAAVADNEQLEHVVEVLVGGVFLPFPVVSGSRHRRLLSCIKLWRTRHESGRSKRVV